MLTNPTVIEGTYKCKKPVMRYLVYDCHLPVFGLESNGTYYFTRTTALKKALDKMPIFLKVMAALTK